MSRILVAGGARDPNVRAVLEAAQAQGVDTVSLLLGEGHNPSLAWNLYGDDLWISGRRATITGAFVRRDVFHGEGGRGEYRAQAWYATLEGWLASSSRVRVLNRGYLGRYTNKLHALRLARAVGLKVPPTVVTNAVARMKQLERASETIVKPVPGGGYCRGLDELLGDTELRDGVSASPAIVQTRLRGADVRIYRIQGKCIGFQIQADTIDYRQSSRTDLTGIDRLPGETTEGLGRLMECMGLDWGAADFKTCPETGELIFLEINSQPMFSAFDRVGGGVIASAILKFLSTVERH